jgi:hypothetical protein
MDVLGGWSVKWEYELNNYGCVTDEQMEAAIKYKDSLPLSKWVQIQYDECKGLDEM